MMKRRLLILSVIFCSLSIYGQETTWKAPCGTPAGKSQWLKKYQRNPQAHYRNTDTIIYVPMTVHLLGSDAGNGHFRLTNLLNAFCKLNADMAESNIQFYLEGEIDYINNSDWFSHETVLEGAEMMFANNVENTLNTYFVSNAAGNCGYNLPYAGVAMDHSCSGANDDTWAHEVGHAFSLPHPFLGWEGGVSYDGSIPPNFSEPAPLIVTYDYTNFKDTLILDTLIIDTAFVEFADGSNCFLASDGFCDTAPDYIAQRWNCNGDGESPQTQLDPNGTSFRSDGTLIMSYSDDACQSRFTPEQIAAMRANLYEEKADYLYNQVFPPVVSDVPAVHQLPAEGELVQFDQVYLEWEAVENATAYVLQVSILPNFGSLTDEYYTEQPNFTLTEPLFIDRPYYWRVKAFSSHIFCTSFSESTSFITAELTSTNHIEELEQMTIIPNPQVSGQSTSVQLNSNAAVRANLLLRDISGKILSERPIEVPNGLSTFQIDTPSLSAGLYFVELRTLTGRAVQKVVIQ
jgi:hypothetical protein